MTMYPDKLLTNRSRLGGAVLGLAFLLVAPRLASAATYDLKADRKLVAMPDGTSVEMWGFGLLTDPEVSVPGPVLEVPPGDSSLTINLTNHLSVPVSIIIPAQPSGAVPTWDDGSTGSRANLSQRVYSLAPPAAPGGGTATYTFSNLQPGTYLYHSGTHPAVQVQMGLYGALRHDAAVGSVYDGVPYDREVLVLFSEVDPALHDAVVAGSYGTAAYPSTVNYAPRFFLVNGRAFPDVPSFAAATVHERVLLRLINAGLRSIVPTLGGAYATVVAEDGQVAPYPQERYSLLLAAGKTSDAILVSGRSGRISLLDRSLRVAHGASAGGGLLALLDIATASATPMAVDDAYAATEDSVLDTALDGAPSLLANDVGAPLTAILSSGPVMGELALDPDGHFRYQPVADFWGTDVFSYYVTDGTSLSAEAQVVLTVAPVADAPVAAADAFVAMEGMPLAIPAPGVLGNDVDVDGDLLLAELVSGPTDGTVLLDPAGGFQYVAAAGATADSFSYRPFDGLLYGDPVTVTITVGPAVDQAPVAVDDYAMVQKNASVIVAVLANDWDPDGALDPASVSIALRPTHGGMLVNPGDGTLVYTPAHNFRGADVFTYTVRDLMGLTSNEATVHVNVVK